MVAPIPANGLLASTPSAVPPDALSLYVRRYLDLAAQITLLESRMDNISPEEATSSLKALDEQLVEPAVVGDVEALRTRISSLKERATARAAEAAAKREEAKAQAIAERTALIERALRRSQTRIPQRSTGATPR